MAQATLMPILVDVCVTTVAHLKHASCMKGVRKVSHVIEIVDTCCTEVEMILGMPFVDMPELKR